MLYNLCKIIKETTIWYTIMSAIVEQESSEAKQHISLVVCGHVDAGKSTTTGPGLPEEAIL